MMKIKISVMQFYDGTHELSKKESNPSFSVYVNKDEKDKETNVSIHNRKTKEKESFSINLEEMEIPDVLIKECFDEQFILLFHYSTESLKKINEMKE